MLSWPKHNVIHSTLQRMTRTHMWRIKRTGVNDVRSAPFLFRPLTGQEKRVRKMPSKIP